MTTQQFTVVITGDDPSSSLFEALSGLLDRDRVYALDPGRVCMVSAWDIKGSQVINLDTAATQFDERELFDAAYALLGDGNGKEWDLSSEYTRGVAELVSDILNEADRLAVLTRIRRAGEPTT
jgi:hypothetical protein